MGFSLVIGAELMVATTWWVETERIANDVERLQDHDEVKQDTLASVVALRQTFVIGLCIAAAFQAGVGIWLTQAIAPILEGLDAAAARERSSRRELIAVESLANTIVERLADGVVAVDNTGRITLWNEAAHELAGVDKHGDTLAAHGWYRLDRVTPVAPDELPLVRAVRGESAEPVELFRFTAKQPRGVYVAISAHALRDERGEITGAVAVFQDLSHRHELDRLKDELVATVSHELRTPLTAIRGSLGLLEAGAAGPLPEPTRDLVAMARSNSERMIRLVNDLLDLSKLDAGRLTLRKGLHAAHDLCASAVAGLSGAPGVERVVVDAAVALPSLTVDGDRVVQVLVNFLSNALKVSPPDAPIALRARQVASALRFEVTDRGPGIPAAQAARLFERFAQVEGADVSRLGTGLGLAICRGLVEQHGGRIGVDSTPGDGATFWFELPVS